MTTGTQPKGHGTHVQLVFPLKRKKSARCHCFKIMLGFTSKLRDSGMGGGGEVDSPKETSLYVLHWTLTPPLSPFPLRSSNLRESTLVTL